MFCVCLLNLFLNLYKNNSCYILIMNNKDDRYLSVIKIWHSIKNTYTKKGSKLDSENINDNIFNNSATKLYNSNNLFKGKKVYSKSFNLKRGDFYNSYYDPII